MGKTKYVIVAAILLATATFAGAQDTDSLQLHILVSDLENAAPPRVVEGYVLFTYAAPQYTRYVAAAFGSESYQKLHPFKKNKNDVFFLLYPLPENGGTSAAGEAMNLSYRLVADGLWMADPNNPDFVTDSHGTRISRVELPAAPEKEKPSPYVQAGGMVTFSLDLAASPTFTSTSNRTVFLNQQESHSVFLAGSFNNWDPFMYPLRPVAGSKNTYRLTLRLPPGTHHYYFVVDGNRILDPGNRQRSFDAEGQEVSTFRVSSSRIAEQP